MTPRKHITATEKTIRQTRQRSRGTFLLAACVWILIAATAAAQEHPFLERGATREALSSVDSVRLSSGAGVINIPIGSRVQIGGELSFGLHLFYNSKVWDTESSTQDDPILGPLPISFPSRKSKAGVGWSLSLGELIPPHTAPLNTGPYWLYIDSSGGNHFFYNDASTPTLWYSRDGSYLRMREIVSGLRYDVEFPSGEVHQFEPGTNGVYRLLRIHDRFPTQNYVDVTYGSAAGLDVVTATDSHGRVWKIHSSAVVLDYGTASPPPVPERTIYKVHKVEVPGFGGSQTWDFHYSDVDMVAGCAWGVFGDWQSRTMPYLDRIELPAATPGSPRLSWDMTYLPNDDFMYAQCKQGLLETVTLPSGGIIRWDYRPLEIRPHCDPGNRFRFYWSKSAVIREREYLDVDGSSLATWKYAYYESQAPADVGAGPVACIGGEGEPASEVLTVREINPLNDVEFHAFVIWPILGVGPGFESEHGADALNNFLPYMLPDVDPRVGALFTPDFFDKVAPEQDAAGRYLSRVVFDCDEQPPLTNCQPFSAHYVLYDNENPQVFQTGYVNDRNDRVVSQRTVYFGSDPSATYEVTTDSSDFDGFGNFRRTDTTSTFPGEPARTLFRDYNAGQSGPFGENEPWVLDTFSVTDVEEGGQGSRVESLFDPDTGFLERERVWADTGSLASLSRRANDILTVYTHQGDGNVRWTSTYGGDRQNNLPNVALEDLVPGNWEYRRQMTYQFGSLKKEEQLGRHGGSLVVRDVDLDFYTGLPTASRDATGLQQTGLDYDALGRLIEVTPPVDAAIVATRTPATGTTGEEILLQRGSGGSLFEERFVQDGFGRNVREEVRFPGGQMSATVHEYGANGLLLRTSTPHWSGSSPAGWTELLDYDPMNRPLLTRHPDGSEISLTVDREHEYESFFKVATGTGVETEVSNRVRKDSRGRVREVEEPSNNGSWVTTSYQYDIGERLARVDTPRASGGFQTRTFDYDNRGYLTEESHPETGTILHGFYDTAGNAGARADGVNQLGYKHDEFGRLHQVWDDLEGRLLSESYFSRTNLAGDTQSALGKVVTAKRHNYLENGDHIIVTQTYVYETAKQGRLSWLRTHSNTGFDITQFLVYDEAGNLEFNVRSPDNHLPGSLGNDRFVRLTYSFGRIVGVRTYSEPMPPFDDLVTDTTYHPQGLVDTRSYNNGVQFQQTVDPSGMPRPGSLRTVGVDNSQDWLSGTYSYDGAGNVESIGSQVFHYDAVSRLKRAEMVAGVTQDYQYDRFGNLVNLGGLGLPVDEATNRLTGYTYDAAGNVLSGGGRSFTYDALNMPSSSTFGGETTHYVYGPGDERAAAIDSAGQERWTMRDPQQRVIREYQRAPFGPWVPERDYIYADGLLAAMGTAAGTQPTLHRRYFGDHLGSPRLIIDGDGAKVSGHTYLPFGGEIPDAGNPVPDDERLKFTGHERDAADLDYLHARYYGPLVGRFLSTDPVQGDANRPQSWNRYSYVDNNPLGFVDPDGLEEEATYRNLEIKTAKPGNQVKVPSLQTQKDKQIANPNKETTVSSRKPEVSSLRGTNLTAGRTIIDGSALVDNPGTFEGGKEAERIIIDQLKKNGSIVSSQVTVETPLGRRVIDALAKVSNSTSGVARANSVLNVVSSLINIAGFLEWEKAFVEGHGREPDVFEGTIKLLGGDVPTDPCAEPSVCV